MNIRFGNDALDRLETDPAFDNGHSPAVVRAYRKRVQMIRAAPDERTFRALKSLHYEKLRGKRDHQHSMRLNQQWRLILELEGDGPERTVVVVEIEDYH